LIEAPGQRADSFACRRLLLAAQLGADKAIEADPLLGRPHGKISMHMGRDIVTEVHQLSA
jgi:hypothetical protein